jgi:hypothetical protein
MAEDSLWEKLRIQPFILVNMGLGLMEKKDKFHSTRNIQLIRTQTLRRKYN